MSSNVSLPGSTRNVEIVSFVGMPRLVIELGQVVVGTENASVFTFCIAFMDTE